MMYNYTRECSNAAYYSFRAKNMSSMAYSMYLFTRGEGPLKNTQDLFTQAHYFADEALALYQRSIAFATQVSY